MMEKRNKIILILILFVIYAAETYVKRLIGKDGMGKLVENIEKL